MVNVMYIYSLSTITGYQSNDMGKRRRLWDSMGQQKLIRYGRDDIKVEFEIFPEKGPNS